MTSYIIDFQGFQVNKTFIVKELAVFDGEKLHHALFHAPFPIKDLSYKNQCTVKWLTQNIMV